MWAISACETIHNDIVIYDNKPYKARDISTDRVWAWVRDSVWDWVRERAFYVYDYVYEYEYTRIYRWKPQNLITIYHNSLGASHVQVHPQLKFPRHQHVTPCHVFNQWHLTMWQPTSTTNYVRQRRPWLVRGQLLSHCTTCWSCH